MMGLETIKEINRDTSRAAKRRGVLPYCPTQAERDILALGKIPPKMTIPGLGDYVPKGWETFGDDLFCDSSGFGNPGEPALTMGELAHAIARDPNGTGYATGDAGQFQIYVKRYRRKLAKARVAVSRKRETVAA